MIHYLGLITVGASRGISLIPVRNVIGANGQLDGQIALFGIPLKRGINHVRLDRGDGAGGGIPGHVLLGEAQLVKDRHKGQAGAALPNLGHRIGEGDVFPIDHHIEVPLLGGERIGIRSQGGHRQQSGSHPGTQQQTKMFFHTSLLSQHGGDAVCIIHLSQPQIN